MKSSTAQLDLATKQRIHVVGVGGPGMSAIAQVLSEMGHVVSGSDVKESETIFTLFPLNYKIDKNDKKDGKFNCGLMKSKELHIIKKNLKSFNLD